MKKISPPKLTIDRKALSNIAIADLSRLSDGLQTISDVVNGIMATPCFFLEAQHEWTDAGEVLERICSFLDHYRAAVVDVICNSQPENNDERKEMIWARIKYEATLGDNLDTFSRMVTSLTAHRTAGGGE